MKTISDAIRPRASFKLYDQLFGSLYARAQRTRFRPLILDTRGINVISINLFIKLELTQLKFHSQEIRC